jgi:uncharacterized protein (DUF433 family)
MAAPKAVPYPHIVRNLEILAGEPTIKGTRIAVRNIVVAIRYTPTVEELLEDYPTLSRDAIEEAFAFYDNHRAEIDRYIAENDAASISDDW